MIISDIRAYLLTQSGVTNLVGNKITPTILPEKPTYPSIVVREEEPDYFETYEGQNDLVQGIYTLDAWGTTHLQAHNLGFALRTALKNYSGNFGSIIVNKITVVAGPVTMYEEDMEAYRQSQSFSIWHIEV